jgi:hypothetical protein
MFVRPCRTLGGATDGGQRPSPKARKVRRNADTVPQTVLRWERAEVPELPDPDKGEAKLMVSVRAPLRDLADRRFWRADLPAPACTQDDIAEAREGAAGKARSGPLEALACNKVNPRRRDLVAGHPPRCRMLFTNHGRAYNRQRMFGCDGHPTALGQAFAEYGRIDRAMHLLNLVDAIDGTPPPDESLAHRAGITAHHGASP